MTTSLALRYALMDLRGALSSFRIVVLCLILGVGAIAAVQITSASVLSGIKENGRTLLGGDVVIRNIYATAPDALKDWFKARGGVMTETVESRVMLSNAVTFDNALVELKAVPAAYPLDGALTTDQPGDFHDLLKDRGILLDPVLASRLNVTVGDSVGLGTGTFTVRGMITHEPDRVGGGSNFGIAPRAMIGRDDLESTGLLLPGSMMYYNLRVLLPDGTNTAQLKDRLEREFPDATWRVSTADNASPGIKRFIDRLMMFLTLVGLSALLVGGIGIGNGIRAHLESRMKTIAIFKSLGAPLPLIRNVYFIQILLISLIGTGLGLLIGALLPYMAAPFLSKLLPFAVEISLSPSSITVPLLYGLLVSFAFSLWPLGQAVATSPLELFRVAISSLRGNPAKIYRTATAVLIGLLGGLAIITSQDTFFAIWFINGAVGSLVVFWAIGWLIALLAAYIPAPRKPAMRLGVRNLHRPGNATANTLISLGLGLTVMISVTLIEMNLRQGIAQNLPKDAPSFFFLDIQSDQKDGFEKLLAAQPGVHTLKFSPNLRGRIVSVKGVPAEQALVDSSESWLLQNDRGFTYTSELPAHSEITSGEWWPADYKGPPLVSVVEDVERGFGVKPGDEITVNILGRDITAKIANTRSVNWMNMTINYAITFAPGALETAPHSWLATAVADPAQEAQIQRTLGKAYPNVTMIRVSESIAAAGDILGKIATAVRVTALVAILTGILVLSGSLAATRTQRLYDVVVLKVIGIRNRTLTQGFLLEFGLLGVVASGLSLGLGCVVSWAVMTKLMNLGWNFYPGPSLLTAATGVALTLAIGWVITGRVLSAPAAPHLRNE